VNPVWASSHIVAGAILHDSLKGECKRVYYPLLIAGAFVSHWL